MGAFLSLFMAAAFRPRLYFAADPAFIGVRKVPNSKQIENASLSDLVTAQCPTLLKQFRPAWWLTGGHLQTFWSAIGDFTKVDKVEYERTLLRTVDGGTLGLDFTGPPNSELLAETTPVIVVLHGLTGGSHESYVRAILAPACTTVDRGGLGYRAVVVNFRGCAGVPLTSPRLYSGGTTDDIRTALMYISSLYPNAPLLGIGFSLGANVLTRYLAEEGERSRLNAGCVLASPWDFVANIEALDSTLFRRVVYSRTLGQNLVTLANRHVDALAKFPDSPMTAALPAVRSMNRPLLTEFDQAMTRLCGGPSPPFPFPSARDYYVWASSHNLLPKIRVPLLAINAADDPLVPRLPVDTDRYTLSPWVVFSVTAEGGHLGWFEKDNSSRFGVKRWITKPVLEWMQLMGEVAVDTRRMIPLRQADGFTKEEGRDDIGYLQVEGGGHVVGVEDQDGLLAGL
ncbi:hypothetical protein EIP91_006484 [Steccherinum ochraceum]|uniref:AB hydrolase-1 domain-containing protein n=1 Tax=Steccherinum ochraceum TaxID=92696 RepID=A0A4V2MXD6_9APHY|nr:hypothetical protein EIP91_006484 [Steccherinum ochraceum]